MEEFLRYAILWSIFSVSIGAVVGTGISRMRALNDDYDDEQ